MAAKYPNRQYSRRRAFFNVNASSLAFTRITAIVGVSSAVNSNGVTTVTTAAAHMLQTGDVIDITYSDISTGNGQKLITVTSTTTFTFPSPERVNQDDTANVSVLFARIPFVSAVFAGKLSFSSPNVGNVTLGFGPSATDRVMPIVISSDGSYALDANPSLFYDLSDFWFKNDTNNDGIVVTFD